MRRKSPQEGQRPSLATGPATSARSQRPRAWHSGLMHCTVRPGRYCIASPQRPQSGVHPAAPVPVVGDQGPRGNSAFAGAHSAPSHPWRQEKNTTRYCGKVAAVENVPPEGGAGSEPRPGCKAQLGDLASESLLRRGYARKSSPKPQLDPDAGPAKYYEEFR